MAFDRKAWSQAYYQKHRAAKDAAAKLWKRAHPQEVFARQQKHRQDKKAFVQEVVGVVCVDCGENRVGAIEYHHPSGRDTAKQTLWALGWEKLKTEVMKIVALCATCHRLRHWEEHNAPYN